jgi:hypothetical protein
VFLTPLSQSGIWQAHLNREIESETDLLWKGGESSTRRRSSPDVGIEVFPETNRSLAAAEAAGRAESKGRLAATGPAGQSESKGRRAFACMTSQLSRLKMDSKFEHSFLPLQESDFANGRHGTSI